MIDTLPRREREIFELLCSMGEASASDVRAAMRASPSDSAVRTLLRRLEARGLVTHRVSGQTYLYESVPQPARVRETALRQLVKTFFEGSVASAATALLGLSKEFEPEELRTLQAAIDRAKERRP